MTESLVERLRREARQLDAQNAVRRAAKEITYSNVRNAPIRSASLEPPLMPRNLREMELREHLIQKAWERAWPTSPGSRTAAVAGGPVMPAITGTVPPSVVDRPD